MREGLSLRPPAVPTHARNASPQTPTPTFGVAMKSQYVSHSEDLPPFTNSTRSSLSATANASASTNGHASAKEGTGTTTSSGKPPASSSSLSNFLSNSNSNSNSILPRMSDPSPRFPSSTSTPHSESPQPMDAARAAPTGSQAPTTMAKDGTDTASPYGTRSRNRNGASRPNYAEDKDLEADYENYHRDGTLGKAVTRQASITNIPNAATQQSTPAAPPRSGSGSARKPLPSSTDDSKQTSVSHHQHHHHTTTKDQGNAHAPPPPASSSASTVTTANAPSKSKKRKAADHAPSSTGNQAPPSSGVQRRHGGAASNGNGASHAHGQNAASGKRAGGGYGETNLVTFEASGAMLKNGKMVADDGTVLEVNDHVYLICEPPGEPYYLGRIMEFLHSKNDGSKPIDALRINWYYRPKDIGKKVQDTRLVFATMHSDISPLTSLRGKCQIRHKAEIPDMAAYKRGPDNFWYERLYDRYIQKNYEVIPTAQIINVPEHVKKVLDERWKFILVEQGRGKELTSAVKTCKRCVGYCASNDSVDCAVCQQTYHMNCVKPPLLKKPSRGFAWSCAACSRAQERKLEARNTPNVHDSAHDDDEFVDDDDDDAAQAANGVDTGRTSPTDDDHTTHQPATAEQIYHASLWPYRYLGIHCKVEDALDYDDRIFPRASTRLGPRHQAVVLPWPGRPVEYVKPLEIKKSGRKDGKLSKDMQAALEAERQKRETRPKWVQDEPPGWVQRGGDDTVTLLYKPPQDCGLTVSDEVIDGYMETAKTMATSLGLPPRSTNLQDVARDVLFRNQFNPQKALKELEKVPRADFKEPELTPVEQKKFEEAVAKFGSELHSVKKHVKTLPAATITRYYYTWKKSDKGKTVWGNYPGRKGKKDAKRAEAVAKQVADDVANDHDDSAFDTDKARDKKKGFICKFCSTKSSRQWRRAPNPSASLVTEGGGRNSNKDKNAQYIQALCRRCAELWRRYAIQWEDVEEVAKKVAQTGGRGWRRRVDEELYKELLAADEMMANTRFSTPDPVATASPAPSTNQPQTNQEPPRKKLKGYAEKEPEPAPSEPVPVPAPPPPKKKVIEKPPPPPVPEIPKPRTLPCAICREMEPLGDQHLKCRECRLTVHKNCYGVSDGRASDKWTCDPCLNDKNPKVSIHYKCVLCPVEFTEHDFVEPPKISHKKKTEKERERERQERENAHKAAEYYRKKQEEMNRPTNPREPLKKTADNNWVHVTCAVWTPEVKFGNTKTLGASEGIPLVPRARYAEVCKACKKDGGACVNCHTCKAPVHVECANQAGYLLGFDITPIKGSRRDQHNIVSINGESGVMSAAVWCKEHAPKTAVHPMHEVVDQSGMNALQFYVQNCKQADLTLTGCARKANQITVASKVSPTPPPPTAPPNRRSSTVTMTNGDHDVRERSPAALRPGGKICLTCSSGVSPKWHAIDSTQERGLTNGYYGSLGSEAQRFVEQRSFQCHKCKKAQRQPRPHTQSPSEPSPAPEPVPPVSQPPPPPVAAQPSPVTAGPPEPRHSSRPWSPMLQTTTGPQPAAQHAPPLQAPVMGPSPGPMPMPIPGPMAPLPVQAPPVAPPPLPPTIAPRAPPMQVPQYSPVNRPYGGDWSRPPPPGHGPPPSHHHSREMNGGPSPPPSGMPPLAPPNHLRPPTINSITHPPPPLQNGHMSQPPPFSNGMPASPRRLSGPPTPQNGGPYMSPHHNHHMGPSDLRSHHMAMNGMPPVAHGPPPQELNYLRWGPPAPGHHQLPPHPSPHHHANPPMPLSRDLNNPPPRENRPASGASASPSLRNLLS